MLMVVVSAESSDTVYLDLRGVKCPLNWAHAKVRLEQMRRHQVLELTAWYFDGHLVVSESCSPT